MLRTYQYVVIGRFATDEATTGSPILVCCRPNTDERLMILMASDVERTLADLSPASREWVHSFLGWIRDAPNLEGPAADYALERIANLSIGPLRTMATGSLLSAGEFEDVPSFFDALRSQEEPTDRRSHLTH